MVVVMQEGAKEEEVQSVINRLMDMGFDIHRSTGARQTVLGAVGAKVDFDTRDIELLDGVEEVYTREEAAFPAEWSHDFKFWPAVARVESAYGDRNLICSCPPTDAYAEVEAGQG